MSGAAIKAEVKRDSLGTWGVYVGEVYTVSRESYEVAAAIAYHLEHPEAWDGSESAEIAESIRKHLGGEA